MQKLIAETLPEVCGWYWMKYQNRWGMVYVDADREKVTFLQFDDNDVLTSRIECHGAESLICSSEWYGPIPCPGGDGGEHTILIDEQTHWRAKAEKKAICMMHVDFRHCDNLCESVSVISILNKEDAEKKLKTEIK